jgi:hypothetical protein
MRLEQWMHNHRQNKHGKHRYELEWYGLDADRIAQHFAQYIERFRLG